MANNGTKVNSRVDLAKKFEIVGRFLEMDGVNDLLFKVKEGINITQYNGIAIQLMGIGMKKDKSLMDELVAMNTDKTIAEVQEMSDDEYTTLLRTAMFQEVLGFFH